MRRRTFIKSLTAARAAPFLFGVCVSNRKINIGAGSVRRFLHEELESRNSCAAQS